MESNTCFSDFFNCINKSVLCMYRIFKYFRNYSVKYIKLNIPDNVKIIVVCGTDMNGSDFDFINLILSCNGKIVLPSTYYKNTYYNISREAKIRLYQTYRNKIQMADGVLILNNKNNLDSFIIDDMNYALSLNLPVYLAFIDNKLNDNIFKISFQNNR
jgi:hypothetical protein